MSYHAYIAREGFKENPISPDTWLAAARQCEELHIEEKNNRKTSIILVSLKSDSRAQFSRTPYGLIDAQDPTEDQMHVMFKLASILDAGVYNDDLYRYESVGDWIRRTEDYRRSLRSRQKVFRIRKYMRIAMFFAVALTCAILGYTLY